MAEKLFFGGAFNPPTIAHIQTAQFACEKSHSDGVVFVPTKSVYIQDTQGKDFAFDEEQRLSMLRCVAKNRPWMQVSDFEIRSEKQPRTYESLCALRNETNDHYRLLFGIDKLIELETVWMYTDQILEEFGVVCMSRSHQDPMAVIDGSSFLREHRHCIEVIDVPDVYQEISSSKVRALYSQMSLEADLMRANLPEELHDLCEHAIKERV